MATKIAVARHGIRSACRIGLIAGVVLLGTACDSPTAPPTVASVEITPQTTTFTSISDTVRFTAEARDASGRAISGRYFAWRAEPAGIVRVDDGLVTAIGSGVARVSATTDTITGSVEVAVVQVVASVHLFGSYLRLTALGDSTPLYPDAWDARAFAVAGTTFSFQSSNQDVVTVSATGSVKAVRPGVASVVAMAAGKADTLTVEVLQDVDVIELSPDTAVIQDGASRQFTARMKDHNGYAVTDRSPQWSSSNASVVAVGSTGVATATAARLGPATLKATSGGASGQAPVYVFTPFIAVAAGAAQTCALSSRGRPYCWGWYDPVLGYRSVVPLAVPGAPRLESIGVGAELACGLANGGAAYCWGSPPFGPSATAVSNVSGLPSLSVGDVEVYGLTSSGGAISWSAFAPSPTPVSGGLSFATISASAGYACATVASGAAYCWGSNLTGALGDSTYQDRPSPTTVHGGLAFKSIAAGGGRTCGITTGGAAYCWGRNAYGAFGDGTMTNSTTPAPAASSLALTSITPADWHTCGLDASGIAYCWGFDARGNLGNGSFTQMQLTPVAVSGGLTFTSVSAGGQHTCGLRGDGSLFCWGRNEDAELGDGTKINRAVPTRVTGSRP